MKSEMTHGEAWFLEYQSEEMVNGVFVPTIKIKIPPVMSHKEAMEYYNKKCRKTFLELGYKYEESLEKLELRLHKIVMQIKKQTSSMLRSETKKLKLALKENNDSICM